jgi:mannosyltransferase
MTTSATATLGRPSDRVVALLLAALGVVLAYAGALRWDASLDDAYVYALSQHGLGDLLEAWANDPQSLVSQLILYPFAAAGSPMWWLRIPTVIAFGASVLALWWTARQRYSPAVSLAAAGLLAISPLVLLYAASTRWQVFALLAGILAWGALFRAIDTGRRGWWVAYTAILVLGIYTNIILVLLVLPQAVAVWWARGRALRPWALSLAVAAVLSVPLAVLTLRAGDVNPLFRVSTPSVREVPGFVAELLGGSGPERVRQILVVVLVVMLAAAAWRLRRRLLDESVRPGWLAVAWLVLPIAAAFVISQGPDSIWLTRYVIATVPAACLCIAWAASQLDRRAAGVAVAAVAALMLVGVVDQIRSDTYETTEAWTRRLEAVRPPGAPVVFYESEGVQVAGYYSSEFDAADGTPIVPGWDATPVPRDIVLLDAPEFDRLPKGPPRPALLAELIRKAPEGVVVLAIRPSDPEPPAITWARERCTVERSDFAGSPEAIFRVSGCRSAPAGAG